MPSPARSALAEITREDVLGAIRDYAAGVSHPFGPSVDYDLMFEGERYPPKAIAGLATRRILGRIPQAEEFSSGPGNSAFRALTRLGFEIAGKAGARKPRVWWVNQGKTYAQEQEGGFIWAPKETKAGHSAAHHTAVNEVKEGDLILHYARGALRALGVATTDGSSAGRPDELSGELWQRDGYTAKVDYHSLAIPIGLPDIPLSERSEPAGPFDREGEVKQGYLYPVAAEWAERLRDRFPDRWPMESPWGQEGVAPRGDPRQIFVFTAGNSDARRHLDDSVRAAIDPGLVRSLVTVDDRKHLDQVFTAAGGFFAWGATPGPTNSRTWESMQVGDWVLCVYDATYRYVARIEAKLRNPALAEKIWGRDGDGETWEYMYFMSKPYPITLPLYKNADYLRKGYMGFTSIGPKSLSRIKTDFGSVDSFMHQRFLEAEPIPKPDLSSGTLEDVVSCFARDLANANLTFGAGGSHLERVRAFVVSLATKRLAILTGLSGSGKTQIALRFGEWLGEDRHLLVPVRPDWTSPESLLGYEDALRVAGDGKRSWYVPKALEFILRASANPSDAYLLILDEMNLAHVERYFADVLSGIESGEETLPNLAFKAGHWSPRGDGHDRIAIPDNLFIVGTVNVDETTYMFSPKVLDRANTFEFRVQTESLIEGLQKPVACVASQGGLERVFLSIARDLAWHLDHPAAGQEQLANELKAIHRILSEDGFEFGHRVYFEALRFASLMEAAGEVSWERALDLQVLQKVLPRVHGARRRVEPLLLRLASYCFDLGGPLPVDGIRASPFDPIGKLPSDARLPLSFDKIRRMTQLVRANQFVSFTD